MKIMFSSMNDGRTHFEALSNDLQAIEWLSKRKQYLKFMGSDGGLIVYETKSEYKFSPAFRKHKESFSSSTAESEPFTSFSDIPSNSAQVFGNFLTKDHE